MAPDLITQHALPLRLVTDTASLVLIWLVQLVVYPAFLHFSGPNFRAWHDVYTGQVTLVVLPIMLSQLVLYGWLALRSGGWDVYTNLALILVTWAITFFLAVPLHNALGSAPDHLPGSAELVAVNWYRTILWSAVWLLTLVTWART